MANNIDIIQLTKYDGTPFYPLVDVNSVAGLSTRLNTIGNNITSLQNGLTSAQGSITTLQGYFDANGKVNYANLPNLYIGNARVMSSAQTAQDIGGLGNLLPGVSGSKNLGSSSLWWHEQYVEEGHYNGDLFTPYVTGYANPENYISLDDSDSDNNPAIKVFIDGTDQAYISFEGIFPVGNDVMDLGGESRRWLSVQAKDGFFSRQIRIGGSNGAKISWVAPVGNTPGYLYIDKPLVTAGDQIVGSGTPGGGGGGGSIPFLTDLQDVIQGIQPSANKMLIWTSQGTNNAGTTGGWTLIDKSSVGVSTDATQSAHGLMSTADKIKLDSIQFGTQASDYIPITIGSTTKNVLTAHQSLAAYATQTWVNQQIDALPEPMVFKGSLGTGGTVTSLPAASSSNEGHTYKVITAGTYQSITAKVGDTFISTGSEWVLIPSGDEPEGTVTSVGLTVPTGLSVSGSPITTSGTFAITFASGYSIPTTANQTAWSNKYAKPSTGIPATDLASAVQTNITNGATAYGYFSSGILPVSHGGTGKDTLTSGSALIGNGTSAVTLRAITNNTVATAVTASTNLITANTLYYHKGNSNIVTVGTITSGTWHGSTIDNDYITNHTITVGSTVFNLGDTKTSLAGLVNVTMTGTLKIGDAEITWDGTNGYLKINKPLLTIGDQIVGSGTPGGGGGGGSIPYLTDLQDVIAGITPTANKMLIWSASGTNNAGTTGGWTLIDKSSVGVTTNASQSAAGLMSSADKIKLDAIEAQANKYVLPLAANGTRGGIQIGYSSSGKNYAVQLSSEKAYVNVPWTDTTYKLTLNGTVKGTTGGADLGSFYAPAGGGTANQVLIAGGNNTAPSWTNQSNLSVGTASKLGSSTVGGTAKPIYLNAGTATALSATVGSATRPVYLNSGTITQVTSINGALVGGYISHSVAGFLVTHPEATYGTIIPYLYNDLAFLTAQGGSCTIYSTESSDLTQDTLTVKTDWSSKGVLGNLFDASPNYWSPGNSYATEMNTDGLIIDIVLPNLKIYGNNFYIDFGNGSWGYDYIDILVKNSATETNYVSKVSAGEVNAKSQYFKKISHTSTNDQNASVSGFDRMRIHLYGRTSTGGVRIAQIGLIQYNSIGHRFTMMSRGYDDPIYRSITPSATGTYMLGSTSKRWSNVYSVAANFSGTATHNGTTELNDSVYVAASKIFYFKDSSAARVGIQYNGTAFIIGRGLAQASKDTYLEGNNVYLRYGTTPTTGITLASTGAVTIAGATTLSSTLAVTGLATLSGGATIPSGKTLKIGDATIEWIPNSGNGYLKIDKPLLTTGDQIVGSGTPSSGGGGGSIPFLTDLQDVISGIDPSVDKMLIWTPNGTNNAGTTGGWTLIDKSSVGVTTVASASANGLMSSSDWSKLNGIEAGANNYVHPTGGANVTISAANGKVLSAITVNNLGHVTSVSSKTLAADDIPRITKSKISDFPTTWALANITGADDLKLIEALTGAGFLKRTASNTWTLDASTYLTSHQTVTLASGTNNGTLKITTAAGTTDNIAVKGLQALAYKASIAFSDLSAHPTTISGYGITDAYTKTEVNTAISNAITAALYFRGESSTEITNGGTETATINGSPWTAHLGDVVLYSGFEFAWDGAKWIKFGDETSYVLKTTTVNGHALSGNVTVTKSDVGLGDVENTKLSTWAGTSNITTLGTITTGTWSGTTIAVDKGGTGKTSWTQYGVLYASGTTTLAQVTNNTTSTKKFLRMTGTGSAAATPAWDTLVASDIPNLDWSKITSGKPTTLSGYGITDAQALDDDLTKIAALSSSGYLKRSVSGSTVTWSLNTISLSNGTITIESGTITPVTSVAVGGTGHTDELAITAGTSTSYITVPFATSATNATTASKLSTVSKTAWGQTFWTSGGIPDTISGNMSSVGKMTFTAQTTKSTSGNVLEVVTIDGVTYLHTTLPFLSDGDQIVGSGSASGGGGGSASYLSDLLDLSETITDKPSGGGYGLVYSTSATDKNGNSGAWIYVASGTTANISGANTTARLWSGNVIKSAIEAYGYVTTDNKVTQTATTTSAAYELLFSATADNTTRTEGARKTSTLTYNPSTKALLTGGTVDGFTLAPQTTGFKISGGTTSKTLTVGASYTLGAACAKAVDTSISAASTSTNLPTSAAVASFVEGKGYITSYTNTWRGVYTGGTSRVGTGTGTKAINFVAGSNVTVSYEAAGTGSGQSGSADYFNVKIAATDTKYTNGTGISLSGTTFSLNVAGAKTALGLGTMAYETASNYLTTTTAASTYVKLSPGTSEQTISSSISSFVKGVINLWRSSGDHYTFLGFSNGTTETYLGGIGFKSQSDHNLYHKDGSSFYTIFDENNYTSYVNTTNFPGLNKTGTVTSVKVGSTSYSPSSGVVSLPAYPTTLPASDVSAWAKAATKPSYTLDEVSDGSTRKLSNYVPTTRTVNSKALSSNITLTLDDIGNGSTRSLSNYVLKAGDTMSGDLIIEKTGGGLTIRGASNNVNANGGYIYLAGRYSGGERNGCKIAAVYPGSGAYDIQDLVFYSSNNRSGDASPVWEEAMRIKADKAISMSGSLSISRDGVYNIYTNNTASDGTASGIRFQLNGTTKGGLFVNSDENLYYSVGTASTGNKVLTSANYDGYALPLSGGTMTGDIMMTDGEYINASNGYAMLGLDTSGNFYCGSGFNVSGVFLIRSGNINLTHRKFTSSSQKTDYVIWDASNSNLSTVDWATNNLTVAGTSTFSDTMNVENRKYMQWKDSGGTYRNIFGLNNSDSLLIGYGLSSVTGSSTVIYGETVRLQATNNNEIVKTGGATLVMRGTQLNSQVHTILFRGSDSESNGFKIQTTAASSYGRQSLGFYRSNVTSGGSPYTPVWKRSLYIPYDGGVIIGTSSDACNLTVYGSVTSSGDQVISSDATLKTNWKELNYTVKDIANVKIGIFDWKDGHGTSAGSVAQDWKKLIPELVHGDEGNMTLAYGQIALLNTVLLARHEDEQDKEIKELKERIKELEDKVKQLTTN